MVFVSEKRLKPILGMLARETATKSRRGHQNAVMLNNESLNKLINLQHGSKKNYILYLVWFA